MPVIVIVSDEQLQSAGVRLAVERLGYLLAEANTSARVSAMQLLFQISAPFVNDCPNCGASESLRPVEDVL